MPKSTVKRHREKPEKPRPDFPLYPHAVGKWAKTIRGKGYYFGRWEDPDGALEEYLEVADDLHAGRTPSRRARALTIRELCNEFLRYCRSKLETGEIVDRTYRDYVRSTDRIVRVLGKTASVEGLRPDDFARLRADIAKACGMVALSNEITRAKVVFNYARKADLIQTPVRCGLSFQRPNAKSLRQARAKNGKRMFQAAECRKVIEKAHTPEIKAMILLGINCGFGNSDCAKLPIEAVDLERAWLDYPRPKTGVERRCLLWPETVEALREVLARRAQGRNLVFVTERGNSFGNDSAAITKEFRKVLDEAELHRPGRNFYTLRHVFRTVADATRDFPAVRLIMGHTDSSIDAVYREGIEDDRLQAVVDHVRKWLYSQNN